MDWKSKFSSIVEETDANIEKLKERLVSTPSRYKNGSVHRGMYMQPQGSSNSSFEHPISSSSVQFSSSYNPHIKKHYESVSGMLHDTVTTDVISQLMVDRLDQQSRVIDGLAQVIQKMESEREYHKQQVRELRNEISQINGRLTDTSADQLVERRLEQVRRELSSEIKSIQNQLQVEASRRMHQPSNSYILAINNDVQEVKHHIQDDIDLVKRDVAVLKSRLNKHEQNLVYHVSSKREIERRQDELDRADLVNLLGKASTDSKDQSHQSQELQSLHDISLQKPSPEKHVIYPIYPSKNIEQKQIQDLKSSIASLQNKLGTVEKSVNKDPITDRTYNNSYGTKKPLYAYRQNDHKSRVADLDLLDGIGGSSDEEIGSLDIDDLTTNDLQSYIPKRTVFTDAIKDEEDYDIDDLNLSSEDDLAQDSVLDSDSLNVEDL